ncbi:MAG: PTS sugar transporter subunit IIA [Planctomycetota bacterium]
MKMREIVADQAIVSKLEAATRDGAIDELLGALIAAEVVDGALRDELRTAILDREAKGSTGFGRGVAIPHVKHDAVGKISAAIGVSEAGIDFSSLDGQPVHCVFLLVSPAGDPEVHLHAMEVIFTNLSKDAFRRFLRQASTADDVIAVLDDADNQRLPS